VRGPICGAEARSRAGLRIATSDASSTPCLSTEHSWPPPADNGPQGCEGELRASPGEVSTEGSLSACAKAAAAGAECLPAWAAALTAIPAGTLHMRHSRATLPNQNLPQVPS